MKQTSLFCLVFLMVTAISCKEEKSTQKVVEQVTQYESLPTPKYSPGDTICLGDSLSKHIIIRNLEPHFVFESDILLTIDEMKEVLVELDAKSYHTATFGFDNRLQEKGLYATYTNERVAYIDNYPKTEDEANVKALLGEIEKIDNSLNGIVVNDTPGSWDNAEVIMTCAVADYEVFADHCEDYPQLRKNFSALKQRIVATQRKTYPIIRKYYIQSAKNLLWEDNIDVYGNNTTITFVALGFANNKNIADVYTRIEPTLRKYRFKRVNFKWSEYADYTYYQIDSKSDTEL